MAPPGGHPMMLITNLYSSPYSVQIRKRHALPPMAGLVTMLLGTD